MKYKAFISYKHSEASRLYAVCLERDLERYAKPLLKWPINIFRDESDLRPCQELSKTIEHGLDESGFLIYLASKEAAESEWVQDELRIWCNQLKQSDKLIIVHLSDKIAFDTVNKAINWQYTDAIPQFLKEYIIYPLCVDLTWAKDKNDLDLHNIRYNDIINSISATLDNMTPEEKNGESVRTTRKNRFLRNIAISAIVLSSIIAVGFGINSNMQRKRAIANYLASEAELLIPVDNIKAIRVAEAARNMVKNDISGIISHSLSAVAYSSFYYPYYSANFIHTNTINSAIFSPDETKILTASDDGTAKLWDLKENLLADLNKHKDNKLTTSVFSPDSTKILTASWDGTAKLWDLKGNLLADLDEHKGPVNSAKFSPDGKRILTFSEDSTAKIWLTPEAIYEWLKSPDCKIRKLTELEKKELGIENY